MDTSATRSPTLALSPRSLLRHPQPAAAATARLAVAAVQDQERVPDRARVPGLARVAARGLAPDRDQDLALDRAADRDLGLARDLDRAKDRARVPGLARVAAQGLAPDRDLGLVRDLALVQDRERARVRDLGQALVQARVRAPVQHLDRAADQARDLALGAVHRAAGPDLARVRDLAPVRVVAMTTEMATIVMARAMAEPDREMGKGRRVVIDKRTIAVPEKPVPKPCRESLPQAVETSGWRADRRDSAETPHGASAQMCRNPMIVWLRSYIPAGT